MANARLATDGPLELLPVEALGSLLPSGVGHLALTHPTHPTSNVSKDLPTSDLRCGEFPELNDTCTCVQAGSAEPGLRLYELLL